VVTDCTRHRSLLREKPPLLPPLPHDAEDSWLEYYESPQLWRETSPSWGSERWGAICDSLGVNPRTEFARAYYWLRDLQHLARPVMPVAEEIHVHGPSARRRAARQALSCGSPDRTVTDRDRWRVKQDLVLYGLLKFHSPSLLETLDPNIPASRLIQSGYNAEICGIGVPEADYDIRLFAAIAARHLWERLIQGRWCCRHHTKIEAVLGNPERWNDEDWWLERRLHSWPAGLQKAGRELFWKQDRWAQMPPWSPCREHCTRHLPRGDRGGLVIRLSENWRCPVEWSGRHSGVDRRPTARGGNGATSLNGFKKTHVCWRLET
jgi:hypothetical protein